MTNHDRIRIAARLDIITKLQSIVQLLSRLALLRILVGDHGHVNGTESLFISRQIILQGHDHLVDDDRRHYDSRNNLLRLLHAKKKVHDKFMLPLQNHRAGGEDALGNMSRHHRTDLRVANFLTVWTIVRVVIRL